jgi:membrane associated rhomboid family serine protease
MRSPYFRTRRSATVVLLIALAAAFVVQLSLIHYTNFPVSRYLALSPDGLRHGYVWQLLTFQFMHGGWLHLLLNCWAIYVFGKEVEDTLGASRFLALYFTSGVVGGLLQVCAGIFLGGAFAAGTVGASAGAFGLIAAFAALYPERVLTLLLFFIIPFSLRAKYLVLFSAVIALLGIVFPSRDGIAHAAHLGGIISGLFFVRFASRWQSWMPRSASAPRRTPPRLVEAGAPRSVWKAATTEAELPTEEFLSREVDPILDKITAQGIHSLTERERRILQSAKDRLPKR